MVVSIRAAAAIDARSIQQIELLAGQRFLEVDMREIAADEPPSLEDLALYARDGRSWVAVDEDNVAIGYALVRRVDNDAHLVQISVVPEMQGRGIGRRLVNQVEIWANEQSIRSITLLTFTHVPWNQPLYEHLGFHVLPESEIGPELSVIRAHEAEIGLDPSLRVAMRKPIHAAGKR
jgi:GNAT superfamily N-acetyltransferase